MNKLTLLLVGIVAAYVSAQCTKTTLVTTEGVACGGTTNAKCIQELYCMGATTTTSGTCKFQPQVGDACSTDADCINNYYNQFCSASKCAIRYKNAGASCTVNGECAGNSCVSGTCAALQVGSACATNGLCGSPSNTLFCTVGSNGTCASTAISGAACGLINNVFVQCQPGLYCTGSGTTGTCQASVAEGATCAAQATSTTGIWANPGCNNANSALTCVSSKCATTPDIAVGQPCDTTDTNSRRCNARESFCLRNVCTAYSSVSCNLDGNCGGGVCNCQADLTKNGTCAVSPYLTTSCSDYRYSDCLATRNTQNILNVCGDKAKANRCCLRNLNLVPSKDLTLAYCSSATFAQVSIVVLAVAAMISLLF